MSISPKLAGMRKDGLRASALDAITVPEASIAKNVSNQCTHSASAADAKNGKEIAITGNATQCSMQDALSRIAARSRLGLLDKSA